MGGPRRTMESANHSSRRERPLLLAVVILAAVLIGTNRGWMLWAENKSLSSGVSGGATAFGVSLALGILAIEPSDAFGVERLHWLPLSI